MGLQWLIRNGFKLKAVTARLTSTNSPSPGPFFVERLKSRTLLRVVGNEVHDYLQGLITNDMNNLNELSECIYAMFLNGKGRVLYDTIIYKTSDPNMYILEGDSSALNPLKKHLLMYRVRRKINVESADDLNLWVVSKDIDLTNICKENVMKTVSCKLKTLLDNCLVSCDPRIPELGVRIIAPKEMNVVSALETLPGSQSAPDHFYRSLRYKLGIGEGVAEFAPGKSFPLEANCDYLNGVSFHKGCYIGQELTARTYHTGVVRKRIMPITLLESIDCSEIDIPIIMENGKERPIGKLKGVEGVKGIALLRIEEALKSSKLTILDKLCTTSHPFWWPTQS